MRTNPYDILEPVWTSWTTLQYVGRLRTVWTTKNHLGPLRAILRRVFFLGHPVNLVFIFFARNTLVDFFIREIHCSIFGDFFFFKRLNLQTWTRWFSNLMTIWNRDLYMIISSGGGDKRRFWRHGWRHRVLPMHLPLIEKTAQQVPQD